MESDLKQGNIILAVAVTEHEEQEAGSCEDNQQQQTTIKEVLN